MADAGGPPSCVNSPTPEQGFLTGISNAGCASPKEQTIKQCSSAKSAWVPALRPFDGVLCCGTVS